MLRTAFSLILGSLVGITVLFGSACGGSSQAGDKPSIDQQAISALIGSSNADAAALDEHADAMLAAGAGRPDQAHLESDAKTIRAEARSLRFLADSTAAMLRDQELFPASGTAIQLNRLLGNGVNLQSLGQSLQEHSDAIQSHITAMREQWAGDGPLLAAADALEGDIGRMHVDGQGAIDRGQAMADEARRIAKSTGQTIESPP